MEMRIDVSGIEFGDIKHVPGTGYERKIRLNTGGLNYVEITVSATGPGAIGGYYLSESLLDDLDDGELTALEQAARDKIMARHPELWGDTPQQPDSDGDVNPF